MDYNFTDEVRKVLAIAREEAVRKQHDHVAPEHLLLALISARVAAMGAVAALGVHEETLTARIERSLRPGKSNKGRGELPYTSEAKRVLELTMEEAREAGVSQIGAGHLLLGILREGRGPAARALTELGLTLEAVRAAIAGEVPDGAGATFAIEIDDSSDHSIYEQIVARVQEVVATGELRAGTRLPPVRRLADQLDIAPGTVARAYSELERLGVVVTEGARGTRVAERNPAGKATSPGHDTLAGLLRPVAVAAYHMGAGAQDLRGALEEAMRGIFDG